MGLITWNSGLETGHPTIDGQHFAMLEAYNDLQNAIKQGLSGEEVETRLLVLRDRTTKHFLTEETLMGQYAGAQAHKRHHADLLAQLKDIVDRFRVDKNSLTPPVMDFLAGWLVFHLKDEDVRLVQFLKR